MIKNNEKITVFFKNLFLHSFFLVPHFTSTLVINMKKCVTQLKKQFKGGEAVTVRSETLWFNLQLSALLSEWQCRYLQALHTSSSSLPWFLLDDSVSMGVSLWSPSMLCFSMMEALATLNRPWILTRTFTFTLELSPSCWGPTFWMVKRPWKQQRWL